MPAEQDVGTEASHEPVVILVQVQAKPGHEDYVKQEVTALFERIRREEPGCRYIAGHQAEGELTSFMYFEQWRDRAEFHEFRETRSYMQDYLRRLDDHVIEGSFTTWTEFTGDHRPTTAM